MSTYDTVSSTWAKISEVDKGDLTSGAVGAGLGAIAGSSLGGLAGSLEGRRRGHRGALKSLGNIREMSSGASAAGIDKGMKHHLRKLRGLKGRGMMVGGALGALGLGAGLVGLNRGMIAKQKVQEEEMQRQALEQYYQQLYGGYQQGGEELARKTAAADDVWVEGPKYKHYRKGRKQMKDTYGVGAQDLSSIMGGANAGVLQQAYANQAMRGGPAKPKPKMKPTVTAGTPRQITPQPAAPQSSGGISISAPAHASPAARRAPMRMHGSDTPTPQTATPHSTGRVSVRGRGKFGAFESFKEEYARPENEAARKRSWGWGGAGAGLGAAGGAFLGRRLGAGGMLAGGALGALAGFLPGSIAGTVSGRRPYLKQHPGSSSGKAGPLMTFAAGS